jgi:hypothetical protein
MTSSFPTKYVKREDPEYQKLPWYQFVLIPGKQGSTVNDYRRASNTLRAALESKELSKSVPHTPANGRELTLGFLREEASHIISQNDLVWVRGCDSLLVRYHPTKRERLTSILSHLPLSTDYRKLLVVHHQNETFAFKLDLFEDEYMNQDSIVIGLVNPTDPAVQRLVERDRMDGFRFSPVYASKEDMEHFALHSLCVDLCSRFGISQEDLKYRYEPLGNSFPDFELLVEAQEWAVEVARVESGMVSYVEVDRELDARGRNNVFRNFITDDKVGDALREEVSDKADKRAECPEYSRCCLLLVDIVDSIGGTGSTAWDGCDLSAFDAVITVRLDGSVSYLKGEF